MNSCRFLGAVLLGCAVFNAGEADAQLTWTGNVNNAWDTTSANWLSGGVPVTYVDGNDVLFTDSGVQTNINVTVPVSPGSVTFSNTLRSYTFTNNILSGTGGVTKAGIGSVNFGSANVFYALPHTFGGGTVINQGALRLSVVTNPVTYNYALGGVRFGFGTGPVTVDGTNATFGFAVGYSQSGAAVLTNSIIIGPNGGTLDLSRPYVQGGNPQNNLSGNIDIYGRFTLLANNIGVGVSGAVWRVMSGVTTLHNATTGTLTSGSTIVTK